VGAPPRRGYERQTLRLSRRVRGSNGVNYNGYALENNKAYLPRPGNRSNEKSDLFALGMAIYEIMTNHEPFPELDEHRDGDEIEKRYRERHFPSVDNVLGGDVIRKCWILAYQRVDECVEDLKHMCFENDAAPFGKRTRV
jgi:hypothetical protein